MEITIGVQYSQKELVIQTRSSAEDIQKLVEQAYTNGSKLLWLVDEKGRHVGVPTDKLSYVELGTDKDASRMGFGA